MLLYDFLYIFLHKCQIFNLILMKLSLPNKAPDIEQAKEETAQAFIHNLGLFSKIL